MEEARTQLHRGTMGFDTPDSMPLAEEVEVAKLEEQLTPG